MERIRTDSCYPDGDIIELFFIPDKKVLTDFGETLRIYNLSAQDLIDIQSIYGIELYHQMLVVRLGDIELSEAVKRITDSISYCLAELNA